MYELEYLVVDSVRVLAASGADPWELRSQYWNLYQFERNWDTSYTHMQHLDTLMAARYLYRFQITDHPDYGQHRAYFDRLSGREVIRVPGGGPRDGGFTDSPNLYLEAGSPPWARMVELGRLTGRDTEPPREIPLVEVALRVATLAEAEGDRDLIGRWYRLLELELDLFVEDAVATLSADPAVTELRALVRRTDALSIPHSGSLVGDPGPNALAQYPGLKWWYTLPDA